MTTARGYSPPQADQGTSTPSSDRRAALPCRQAGERDAVSTVEYIADMALSLRDIAAEADQAFLGYLLEMVFQEAHSEALKLRFSGAKQPCAMPKPQ